MLKGTIGKMKKERLRKERQKTAKNIAIGAISGITAGIAGGILLAPKSGKETRNNIVEGALKVNAKIKQGTKGFIQNQSNKLKSNSAKAKEKIFNFNKEKKSESNNDEAGRDVMSH